MDIHNRCPDCSDLLRNSILGTKNGEVKKRRLTILSNESKYNDLNSGFKKVVEILKKKIDNLLQELSAERDEQPQKNSLFENSQ